MPRKTKIVHLITLLELGGAQGNTIYTAENLNPDKYETYLWSGRGAYWDNDVGRRWAAGGRIKFFDRLKRSIHPLYDVWVIYDLVRAFKETKPQILHTHSSKAGIVGRIAARIAGVPRVIHTYHGFGFNKHQKFWTRLVFITLERFCAPFSHKLIFVSEANREEARALKIGKDSQYELIRSGIPLQQLINKAAISSVEKGKRSLGISSGPVLTTIGAFKPQKNLTDFLKVAKEVLASVPTAHFLIVGDGEQRLALSRQCADNKLEEQVTFLGWRQDVPALLAITDIFVLTSLWEGLPRALVEAMALGIPSVCYDTDGVRDILSKGGGYMVPQYAWKESSQKIVQILQDETLRQTLSVRAKAIIDRDFDIDYMVKQLDDLYEKVLAYRG